MEKLKSTRILSAIGLVCLFFGVILPYFKATFFGYTHEIKLWGYWEGKIMMALIVANILFIFKDYVEKYVPQLFNSNLGRKIQNASEKYAIIPTIGVAAFAIWLYIRLDIDTTYLKHGLGFWTLWIGVICLVAHTFLYKKENENHQVSQQVHYSESQPSTSVINNEQQFMNDNIHSNVKRCPGCGNQCDSNAVQCFMCGRMFS